MTKTLFMLNTIKTLWSAHFHFYYWQFYFFLNETFNLTGNLYRHIKNNHIGYDADTERLVCPYCPGDHVSSCMSNFVIHLRGHTQEKPWSCPFPGCFHKCKSKSSTKSRNLIFVFVLFFVVKAKCKRHKILLGILQNCQFLKINENIITSAM
jgi:hypothetical protein